MEKSTKNKQTLRKCPKYEYVPPEGGWGYVIVAAIASVFSLTCVQMTGFGFIYGKFLASVGDETSGTTMINGIFNTVLNFSGLAANPLLKKITYRKLALIGALLYLIGCGATIFVKSQVQMMVSYGILEGFGYGLMLPSFYTAMNAYFQKKRNLAMGIAQTVAVTVIMACPAFNSFLINQYGFRGTVAIIFALTLNCIAAALTLQPVQWHMKKVSLSLQEACQKESTSVDLEKELGKEIEVPNCEIVQRHSIISSGLHGLAKTEYLTKWQKFSKAMDLEFFKNPFYLSMSFGLALSFTSDMTFIAIFPMILTNLNFDPSQVTMIMTIFFASDLVSRILLTIVSGLMSIRNRYLFLGSTLLSAAFRIAFALNHSFVWIAIVSGALGFLRCFIQTPLVLVIAEEYPSRFPTAYSLYMVICGIVSLIFGPLLGYVKAVTQSDMMVLHTLTIAFLLCGIPWTIELLVKKIKTTQNKK